MYTPKSCKAKTVADTENEREETLFASKESLCTHASGSECAQLCMAGVNVSALDNGALVANDDTEPEEDPDVPDTAVLLGPFGAAASSSWCAAHHNLINVLLMSGSFCCSFTAFQTTSTFAVKLLGDVGSVSLALIYAAFAVSGLVAPAIHTHLGPKRCMFVGACALMLYIASLIYLVIPVVLVMSAVVGGCAGLLWVGQGSYLTLCTNTRNRGAYSGIFWGVFNLATIPGSVTSHFILEAGPGSRRRPGGILEAGARTSAFVKGWDPENSPLFVLLTAVAGLGCCCFLTLRAPDPTTGTPAEPHGPPPTRQKVAATARLLCDRRVVPLLPIMTFCGVVGVFWQSWFTRQMHKTQIGLVIATFGAADFVASLCVGRVADKLGRWSPFAIGAGACLVALALSWSGDARLRRHCGGACSAPLQWYAPFYGAAVFLAMTDAGFQVGLQSLVAEAFAAQSDDVFALYRTLQSLGMMGCLLLTPALGTGDSSSRRQFAIELGIVAGSMLLAVVGYVRFRFVRAASELDM